MIEKMRQFFELTDTSGGHLYFLLMLTFTGIGVCILSLMFKDGKILWEIGRSLFDGALACLWYAMKSGNKEPVK